MSRARGMLARIRPRPSLACLLVLMAGLVIGAMSAPASLFLYLLYISVSLLLGVVGATTLAWMLYAWRTPGSLAEGRLADEGIAPAHSFSLIVPARHEEAVLGATLEKLAHSEHPDFEVIVVVGADDHATREVAERAAGRHPGLIKVVVDATWPKSKPKSLNMALPHCAGTLTGVFDAEDDVHPALLARVDQCFQQTGADVVQAGVQLMNFTSSWLSVHNVLEYYFWFRSRLHLHARQRFIPLGGNTVFIRTPVLRAVSGWDPECLAEDCELGVRLSALGAHTTVFYEPDLVTREECPPTMGAFVRQRTRWNQGYLQTLWRGHWRRLPPRQRALGIYILAMPFVMALAWLLVPVAIGTAVVLKAPVPITLISFLPSLPLLSMLAMEVASLGEFCRAYGQRASVRDYARIVLGLPAYQVVLSFSAARAVAREARGTRGWEKTAHLGLHLAEKPGAPERSAAARRRVAALRPGALRATWQRARGMSPTAVAATAGGGALADDPVACALPGSVAGARDGAETDPRLLVAQAAGAPAGSPGVLAGSSTPNGDTSTAGGGNGQPAAVDARLLAAAQGEPLWVRLNGVPAPRRTAVPAPPSPPAAQPGPPAAHWRRLAGPAAGFARSPAVRWRRLAGWAAGFARSHADLLVQAALLPCLAYVQVTNAAHWPAATFDEGTYVGNAWAAGTRGELAFYTYTYGHPPLGWLPITIWTKIGGLLGHGTYSLASARYLMCVVAVISFSLLYILARRVGMNHAFAALTVTLFALSPLAVYFHRSVLLDNPETVWAIAAFVLAFSPRRRLWSYAGSGACLALSVLSKETGLILAPAVLFAVLQNSDRRTRRYCLGIFLASFVLIGSFFPLYATLKGELLPGPGHVSLIGTDINMLFTRKGSGSIFNSGSPSHGTLMFWLYLDPWLPWAGLALSPAALAFRRSRALALALLIQVAMMLRSGYLPAMYVTAQLPFDALVVAYVLQALWRSATARHALSPPALSPPGVPPPGVGQARVRALASMATSVLATATPAASAVCLVAVVFAAGRYAAPAWVKADHAAMTQLADAPETGAEHWLLNHVGRKQRIIVTDDFWIYLIEHGFDSHPEKGGFNSPAVVSYWPLDRDPAVTRYFPYRWREFSYIVSTPAMRATETQGVPSTFAALHSSYVVASFGYGQQRIEIRKISPTPAAIGPSYPGRTLAFTAPAAGPAPSLDQVARMLRVSVLNIVAGTNRHRDEPVWWYYEGMHKYRAPLPRGITLYYSKT